MKLLKNQLAWRRWSKHVNRGQPQMPINPPIAYPCFAYLTVWSFGYEEEQASYIYPTDLRRMVAEIASLQPLQHTL